MKLTLTERETILLFNEGEPDAEIYTFNEKLKHRLTQAEERYPEIYKLKDSSGYGSVTYTVPKKWLSIAFRVPLSKQEIQRRSKQGKSNDMNAIRRQRCQ